MGAGSTRKPSRETQSSARGWGWGGSGLGSGEKNSIRGITLGFSEVFASVKCLREEGEKKKKISSPLSRDFQPSLPAIVSPNTSPALRARTMHTRARPLSSPPFSADTEAICHFCRSQVLFPASLPSQAAPAAGSFQHLVSIAHQKANRPARTSLGKPLQRERGRKRLPRPPAPRGSLSGKRPAGVSP